MSRRIAQPRRRPARRRLRLLAACVAAAAVVAVLAVLLAHDRGGASAHAGGGGSARGVTQEFNGPPAAEAVARRPLDVHLNGTHDRVHLRFRHPPRSGLLFDLDTGEVLWRHEPERILPIASLTKMTTALVVVENSRRDDRVLVTKQALAYRGSGVGVLPKGKRVKLETMLNGLLLPSGNDAAIALAQHVGGSVKGFVTMMNAKARALNLPCTRYSGPDGFVDRGNHSCAADLASLARADLDQPRIARIVRRRQAVLPFPIKGGKLWLYNHNPLIRMGYRGVTGVKTGFTDRAGRCIVATATRAGRRLGVVLLHSPDTGRQATQLLNAGFRRR